MQTNYEASPIDTYNTLVALVNRLQDELSEDRYLVWTSSGIPQGVSSIQIRLEGQSILLEGETKYRPFVRVMHHTQMDFTFRVVDLNTLDGEKPPSIGFDVPDKK